MLADCRKYLFQAAYNISDFSAARHAILSEEYNYQCSVTDIFYKDLLQLECSSIITFDIFEFLLQKSKFVGAVYCAKIKPTWSILEKLFPIKREETLIDLAANSFVSAIYAENITPLMAYNEFKHVPEGTSWNKYNMLLEISLLCISAIVVIASDFADKIQVSQFLLERNCIISAFSDNDN